MKIIISPAKKMNRNTDYFPAESLPEFLEKTKLLLEKIRGLDFSQAQALWKCNEGIARQNFVRFQEMEPDRLESLTPALLAYEGIQYQYLSPMTLETAEWDYIKSRLRILSGFYGVLRPMDGVEPYRLEMQAGVEMQEKGGKQYRNLYEFWGDSLYRQLLKEEAEDAPVIVNLASKEYSRCAEAFLEPHVSYITCVFGEKKDGKIRQKATMAKMARGEMVRFMAQNRVEDPNGLKEFNRLGFSFSPKDSETAGNRAVYTFLKEGEVSCT